jgi:hypothetical protein
MAIRRRVDCFPDGHPGYGDWLAEYPLGYVLTHLGHHRPAVLHRADCPHISSPRQKSPQSGQCEKWSAPKRATLREWASRRADFRDFSALQSVSQSRTPSGKFRRDKLPGFGSLPINAVQENTRLERLKAAKTIRALADLHILGSCSVSWRQQPFRPTIRELAMF